MVIGDARFLPCTPAGILELLIQSKIETIGKQVVVIGRSMIVGKPLTNLLVQKGIDATVTLTHSRTKNIQEIILKADIVIAAIGASNFVTRDMIREGSIIIDVGMNRDQDGTLCGDVDFQDVIDKVAKITPVPGGVGPMTIAMLARNTFLSASGESSSQA
jgi:methylenetetrahydrofolate dehydrogenase (NADP+)/methenyltetrahydrofolate cyclohydrolase